MKTELDKFYVPQKSKKAHLFLFDDGIKNRLESQFECESEAEPESELKCYCFQKTFLITNGKSYIINL